MSSSICRQRRPRSDCASAQSDQGLHCPLTEPLNCIECIYGEQMPRWDFAHVWDESESVHFVRMFIDTFSLGLVHMIHDMWKGSLFFTSFVLGLASVCAYGLYPGYFCLYIYRTLKDYCWFFFLGGGDYQLCLILLRNFIVYAFSLPVTRFTSNLSNIWV